MAKRRYTVKKFNGDDQYSYAVFNMADVKGMRSPICDPYIRPVINGLTRADAQYRDRLLRHGQS